VTDVLMPRLSDSMEEGTILSWLVDDGGEVKAGQELAEIETDKATMTYEAQDGGVLTIVAGAGETVAVGEVIARVGEVIAGADKGKGKGEGVPAATRALGEPGRVAEREIDREPHEPAQQPSNGHREDVAATPMARRIAAIHGVALGQLQGTGPRGRVVKSDVLRAAGIDSEPETAAPGTAPTRPAPAPTRPAPTRPAPAPTSQDGDQTVTPTRLQALVARRMAEAKATIPHFQVQTEVEMTAALTFREQLKRVAADREQPAPSLNDLIVKACALALRRFPRANGSYADGAFRLHARVNVGIAVAADDALVVPVVHDADTRTLGEIAGATRELAAAVRDGSVTPPQLSGATFTVSNLGMFGMTAITPVINPPQAAILGVGAIREVLARAESGEIVDGRLLTLTLSCDHRILYGADAARFLGDIRGLLEDPAGLAL
jgi:pyruvate dehydrogenase E2 component (dihydrolipoamide acetyltransferase)